MGSRNKKIKLVIAAIIAWAFVIGLRDFGCGLLFVPLAVVFTVAGMKEIIC